MIHKKEMQVFVISKTGIAGTQYWFIGSALKPSITEQTLISFTHKTPASLSSLLQGKTHHFNQRIQGR